MATQTVLVSAAPMKKTRSLWIRGREGGKVVIVTFVTLALLFIFLSPFFYMLSTAFKTPTQMTLANAPKWPALPAAFEYNGEKLDVYKVPLPDGTTKELALLKPGQKQSTFIDPSNPTAEPIVWQGSWRALQRPWSFAPTLENFTGVWQQINYPRLLGNTIFYAIMTEIGTLISCVLVSYGFARFRFPYRDLLFMLVISTIFLPGAVTLIPTYTFFTKIGWVGTWLPLIVPAFFANAYDVFLLRQFFMTLPRELDEAAKVDGAGSMRILWSVILPQSIPVLVAVTVFHIVWAWNDFFGPLIYLSTKPELQPISVALTRFNGIYGTKPTMIQAASLLTLILPMILFFAAQRFFIQGIVITGVEK